ncbi:hypothetical protein KVR01_005981 [Diaporthe batatas]|uniref:uncharacterized protein n=1 Tax=Diaporthe batatas TaxID=748121 RepID=UPI001D057297|nr:uncharacterized protein KVR01_005981 [Diaporthe batatas]KAG8164063.1 hypothetical protein KVR01_005981 [Diaporthe batatas]
MDNDARRNHVEQEQGNSPIVEATSGQPQTANEPQPVADHRRRSSAEQQSTLHTKSHPNNSTLNTRTHNAVQRPRLAPLTNAFDQDLRRLPPPRGRGPDTGELPPAVGITAANMANNSWSFPKAKNILSLLPNLTWYSVVKSNSLATIRMIFGDTPSQCHLEIDVYAQKIPYIARELFGLTFDVENGRLTMRATESCANMTFEKVTLTGADLNGSEKIFGEVFRILKDDPLYEDEIENGMPVTSLVSLDIRARSNSFVNLNPLAVSMFVICFLSQRSWSRGTT